MTDRYLWDRTGKPDPEVEHLERVLSILGEPGPLEDIPLPPRPSLFHQKRPIVATLCVAAATVIIGLVVWSTSRPHWEVKPLAGVPRVGSKVVTHGTTLHVGELLETDGYSKARLTLGDIAILEVQPNTALRVTRSRTFEYRLSLERGKIKAVIFAPPNRFFVDTPSAVAIDLGCTYTVEIDEKGSSIVHVTHGLVALQSQGLGSYILGGAVCVVRKNASPDTPYYCDAAPAMVKALQEFDGHPNSASLQAVLTNARKKDALSLWHLIPKTVGAERVEVVDRLADFVAIPGGVTRDGVLQDDKAMLKQWWTSIRADLTHP